ncbi:MAG: hypothetical protein BroJett015_30190 [Chloroflexota bacterium]|nr:DUF1997 domain-containing protein [Chloroflexota bacterium]GIK57356.1 MAG: hypothetical protein BroJett015_30190 [Chloroflexota bacterium]
MMQISGSIQRAFIFPAEVQETLTFFSELIQVAQFMPHISLVHTYAPNQIRVMYETVELGSYTIRIFTDLEGNIDRHAHTISVYPVRLETAVPIKPEATLRETVGHGLFAIQAQLYDLGGQTRLEANLRLQAELEQPRGMNLMPKRVINRIAQGITDHRMREMADGFIRAALAAYHDCEGCEAMCLLAD